MQQGSQAIVDALISGLSKFGGRLALGFHVTSILPEDPTSFNRDINASAPASREAPTRAPATAAAAASLPAAPAPAAASNVGRATVAAAVPSTGPRNVATSATQSGGSSAFGWPTGRGTEDGAKAGGVELRAADGSLRSVCAREAVICNASVWDTVGLLDAGGLRGGVRGRCAAEVAEEAALRSGVAANGSGTRQNGTAHGVGDGAAAAGEGVFATEREFEEYARDLEMNESMMHLHVGFTARDGAPLALLRAACLQLFLCAARAVCCGCTPTCTTWGVHG